MYPLQPRYNELCVWGALFAGHQAGGAPRGGGRGCRYQRAPVGPRGPRDLPGSDLLDSASNEEEKEEQDKEGK